MDHSQPHPDLYNIPWLSESFNGMPYRVLGRSGLRASSVGLGTWKFGLPETGDGARVDEKTAYTILDRAVELGVTFWDTANRYNAGSGNSERVIGRWLAANPDQRRNVVIATKLFGGMDGRTPNHSHLSRINILESLYASLERLNTDSIDLLYFHSYDPRTPAEESLCAVEDLIRQDLVRYFGVSNFTVSQLQEYRNFETSLSSRCKAAAVQNQYDILSKENRDFQGVLEHAASGGISFIAWSPLARGLLTSRYLDDLKIGSGDRLFDEKTLQNDLTADKRAKLIALSSLANRNEIDLTSMAIAYMLTLPGMGPVIPAASSIAQLETNAGARLIDLGQSVLEQIRAILDQSAM